jgi:hypothetical protein
LKHLASVSSSSSLTTVIFSSCTNTKLNTKTEEVSHKFSLN